MLNHRSSPSEASAPEQRSRRASSAEGALLQVADVGQAEVVDAGGHLAGVVVGEMLLGILWGHCGQQECPALLVDGLVVKWPCNQALNRSSPSQCSGNATTA